MFSRYLNKLARVYLVFPKKSNLAVAIIIRIKGMNNLILSITRNVIPYVKELRPLTGSVTACILMQQLDYWFSKKPLGFYKFLEPCEHPKYFKGDSWLEELGFSAEEFRNAYDKIGVRYKSKSDFDKTPKDQRFKGKFYACFYDRIKRQIFYIRNDELVDATLLGLIRTKNSSSSENNTGGFSETGNHSFSEIGNIKIKKPKKMVSIYNNTDNNTDILSSYGRDEDKIENSVQQMVNTWDEIIRKGDEIKTFVNPERKKNLAYAIKFYFNNDLKKWRDYCIKIYSSRFLMGETKENFSVKLDWALKSQSIEKILEGTITTGDREFKKSPQKLQVSSEETAALKKQFIQEMKEKNLSFSESEIEYSSSVRALFKNFLMEKLSLRTFV